MKQFHQPKLIITAIAAAILCSGCVITSFNPFFTDDLTVQAPEITGTWNLVNDGSDQFKVGEVKSWVINDNQILTFDKKGHSGPLDYTAFKIDGQLYLDAIPSGGEGDISQYWAMGVIPTHHLLKVTLTENQLNLSPLNHKWFEDKQKLGEFKYSIVSDEYPIATEPSTYWVNFLKEHKDAPELFMDFIVLERAK